MTSYNFSLHREYGRKITKMRLRVAAAGTLATASFFLLSATASASAADFCVSHYDKSEAACKRKPAMEELRCLDRLDTVMVNCDIIQTQKLEGWAEQLRRLSWPS